jgi:hypothetical protein
MDMNGKGDPAGLEQRKSWKARYSSRASGVVLPFAYRLAAHVSGTSAIRSVRR